MQTAFLLAAGGEIMAKPIPNVERKSIGLSMDYEIWEKTSRMAYERGITFQGLVSTLLAEFIAKGELFSSETERMRGKGRQIKIANPIVPKHIAVDAMALAKRSGCGLMRVVEIMLMEWMFRENNA